MFNFLIQNYYFTKIKYFTYISHYYLPSLGYNMKNSAHNNSMIKLVIALYTKIIKI